jgi:hypothetical protein
LYRGAIPEQHRYLVYYKRKRRTRRIAPDISNHFKESNVSQQIVQINFNFDISLAEYAQMCESVAQPIADTKGLRWKVWLMNQAEREAGGVYLFDNEASAQAFLAGPIVAGVAESPALSNISVKTFGVMQDMTRITRGPIAEPVQA